MEKKLEESPLLLNKSAYSIHHQAKSDVEAMAPDSGQKNLT